MLALLYGALAIPLIAALLVAAVRTPQAMGRIHIACSSLTTSLLFSVVWQVHAAGPITAGIIYVDELSSVLLLVIAVLTFTSSLFSLSYMKREQEKELHGLAAVKRYYVLLNVFCFTMLLSPVVENLGLMWVAVEATTLASALLVAFSFNRASIEAAWKYVMICTVGLCLALLGTIVLYFAQLSTLPEEGQALSWLALMADSASLDPAMLKIAFIFIIIGYGAKAGLAPMHTWLPDAHSQAPSPVSGLLSGALLSCALYVIMRNLAIVRQTAAFPFVQELLLALGLLSVVIVIPFLLVQHDIKRLLAYSSVEHMGIITLALGIGTPLAVYGALLHIVNHGIAKSALFYLAGIITQEYRTKQLLRIRGLLTASPLLGGALLLFVLIITGAPPFGIFFSKLLIIWAAFAAGFSLAGVSLLLLLGAVFAGMMYYCFQMVFSTSPSISSLRLRPMGREAVWAVSISVLLIAVSGWWLPEDLERIFRQAAAVVTGG